MPQASRQPWIERGSVLLAVMLLLLGASGIAGWWARLDVLVQPWVAFAPFTFNAALCVCLLGAALLALELRWFTTAWCALPALALAALTVGEDLFSADFRIDELFTSDHLLVETAMPGRMSLVMSLSLVLVAAALLWRNMTRGAPTQAFAGAVAGSIVAAVGGSCLLGYVGDVPAAYTWGTATAASPLGGFALALLGLALLLLAWREAQVVEEAMPFWLPVPVVTACLTLTLIVWIGLRAREEGYIGARTQTAAEGLATAVNYEIERQRAEVGRLAANWSQDPPLPADRNADAELKMQELAPLGCAALLQLGADQHTRWVYPAAGNEAALNFDHHADPVRAAALDRARVRRDTTVSGTVDIRDLGKGFAVYSPLLRPGNVLGYVAAEYPYRPFFASLVADRKLASDYRVQVEVGTELVYDSAAGRSATWRGLFVTKTYPIFDRRIRLTFTPSPATVTGERRLLPELALLSGFGITALLGLSLHFARRAGAGQRAAERYNRQLIEENEERRRVEERLKVSDERLRLALDSTQIGIFERDLGSGHTYFSPALWEMLGYPPERMAPTVGTWQGLIHPEDLPGYRERLAAHEAGRSPYLDHDYRVRAADGTWRWVYVRGRSVGGPGESRPRRVIGTVQDITARREAELALRASQAEARKLAFVASRTDNPVLIGTPDGVIEWVNESFCRKMEYPLAEVVGRNPADFMVGPETNPWSVRRIRAAMARGRALSTDVVNYSKSGRKYHLHLEIQPVHNEAGELVNFIAIESDITARVEMEAQLRRAKAEADAASRAKSEFLASMSHEIRTPMNGVIGMTSLLMGSTLTPEQQDYVNTIRVSGEALLTIINDILDFSKIESGRMEIERLPFDLASCVEETLDLFAMQATEKKLELTYHFAPGVPPWIVGDATRLRQILVNLVNNAVKFTPSGSIAIEARVAAAAPMVLEFTVRDTGIGIPPDRLDRLFKAFSQIDSSTTRKYGGTGLGLVISRSLAHLMGGDMRVESTVGQGAAFTFTITTEAVALPAEGAALALPPRLAGRTVVAVAEHPVTQARLESLLAAHGLVARIVASLPAAAEVVAGLPQPPALLLIDGKVAPADELPNVLPGVAAPRILMLPFGQSAPAATPASPPFLIVYKPVKASQLLQALIALGSPAARASSASGFGPAGEALLAKEYPLNLLLAEDNNVNQKVALRFLERLGYRADAVSNGLEVIAALNTRHYDVVLMDLQMPEMDGLEASREIRRLYPLDRQPKIVALTANAMQGDRELCLAAGMDDYISKPVKLPEISAVIRRLFGKAGERPPAAHS
ncbi:MAG: PAS domain S-box protein [Verrucomicrobia bacterium]|nr:PAS domain S-box protein [Verrucomicrobiota bacterium]